MNVLFVCTGNICRSPLAEGILRQKYSDWNIRSIVDSCGFESFHTGDSPDNRAQQVARANGIDISTHSSRLFRIEDFEVFDRIFVMDSTQYKSVMRVARNEKDRQKVDFIRNVIYPGQNQPVKDPYYDHFSSFETVFEQLDEACARFAESLAPAPSLQEIKEAHQRIHPFIHRTPVMTCQGINHIVGAEIWFKCENMQKVGAFKARGATNAVRSLDPGMLRHGVATHSSGNHAQALSWAARLAGINAHIVMPSNSSRVKVEAVKSYGGKITLCEPNLESRETTLASVIERTGAIEIHPYNNLEIIAGQATATVELLEVRSDMDIVMAPVGGGGLLSGTALACRYFAPEVRVIAAEPAQADDAFRSFTQRTFIPSVNPNTIADGLRTSLGSLTFPIILAFVDQIITVSEESIIAAMRLLWERMKVVVEPSAAVPLAALMEEHKLFRGKKIGIILSGGNADLEHLPWKL